MKNLFLLIALVLSFTVLFSLNSCSENTETIDYEFEVDIDGEKFEGDSILALRYFVGQEELIGISVAGKNPQAELLIFMTQFDPGTYDISTTSLFPPIIEYLDSVPEEFYSADKFVLIITSHDEQTNRIEGTFDAELSNNLGHKIFMTNGAFDVVYKYQ